MSLIDEAIAEFHTVVAKLRDEGHAVATDVESALEKLGLGLAEAGTVVDAVSPGIEAAAPAVSPLVRDVHIVAQAAEAGDEAAQAAVKKIEDATAAAKEAIAPGVVESNVAPADGATTDGGSATVAPEDAPAPSEPATGDGSAAPSPGETGHVEGQDTPPVTAEQ